MDVTVTVTAGNDTEGIVLDSELVSSIWPNLSDAAVASGARDAFKLQLFEFYVVRTGQTSYSAAQNWVNQHTTDTH